MDVQMKEFQQVKWIVLEKHLDPSWPREVGGHSWILIVLRRERIERAPDAAQRWGEHT